MRSAKTIKNNVKCNQQKSAEELLIALNQYKKEIAKMKQYRISLEKARARSRQ